MIAGTKALQSIGANQGITTPRRGEWRQAHPPEVQEWLKQFFGEVPPNVKVTVVPEEK